MTTPTRQDVLDALLAERIAQLREDTQRPTIDLLDDVCNSESKATGEATGIDLWNSVTARYYHGRAVLRDWRLVQSETFDGEDLAQAEAAWDARRTLGVVGHLVNVYYGYIPTHDHMRYVGLAPRQQED